MITENDLFTQAASRMHENSMQAFSASRPLLNKREELILGELKAHGSGTDRQIARRLNLSDLNMCRPRLSSLIDKGLVRECGSMTCPTSKRTVRIVEAV